MFICAIVVNYNSAKELESCVQSLLSESVDSIVLVDNASPHPGEIEALRRISMMDRRIVVLPLPENRGFGAGVNAGIACAASKSTHYLLMNPDAELTEGALQILVQESSDAYPGEIVSPRIVRPNGDVWFDGGSIDIAAGRACRPLPNRCPNATVSCSFVSGAVMLIPRSVHKAVGPFRDDLFMYWEDVDYCLRAYRLGIPIKVVRSAVAIHEVGSSSSTPGHPGKSPLWYYYMNRNRVIVCVEAGASMLSLLFGAGFLTSMRLLVPSRRAKRPFALVRSASRGILAGIREVRS